MSYYITKLIQSPLGTPFGFGTPFEIGTPFGIGSTLVSTVALCMYASVVLIPCSNCLILASIAYKVSIKTSGTHTILCCFKSLNILVAPSTSVATVWGAGGLAIAGLAIVGLAIVGLAIVGLEPEL